MKILFLSRWFPFPADNGSKIRIQQLLAGLSNKHRVTLLSFIDSPSLFNENIKHYPYVAKIKVVPWKPYNSRSLRARLGFFSSVPRFILDTYSPLMEKLIRDTLDEADYDLIVASALPMASYYRCFSGIPALFEELELGLFHSQVVEARNPIVRLRNLLTWYKLRGYVSSTLNHYHACTVVSEQEYVILKNSFPAYKNDVQVIPNCINLENYSNFKETPVSNQLVFTGSFQYRVNYEAMLWFIHEVFPLIMEYLPETKLVITGDHANLPLPPMKNVILTGYVEDIKSLIASSAVSIAPLWSGGGTRLKILEAMAIGTPVVSTSKGAEGLCAKHDAHLLIADSPEDFANCVIMILKDSDLRENLAKNAKRFVKEKYDWASVMPRYLQLIERISSE